MDSDKRQISLSFSGFCVFSTHYTQPSAPQSSCRAKLANIGLSTRYQEHCLRITCTSRGCLTESFGIMDETCHRCEAAKGYSWRGIMVLYAVANSRRAYRTVVHCDRSRFRTYCCREARTDKGHAILSTARLIFQVLKLTMKNTQTDGNATTRTQPFHQPSGSSPNSPPHTRTDAHMI